LGAFRLQTSEQLAFAASGEAAVSTLNIYIPDIEAEDLSEKSQSGKPA
jgi:hypothetical protein